MSKAIDDVVAERQRQIDGEGWTVAHDDQHNNGELAKAAAAYASYGASFTVPNGLWPWSNEWWKPTGSKRRALVKAGALILAEIERLDRTCPHVNTRTVFLDDLADQRHCSDCGKTWTELPL